MKLVYLENINIMYTLSDFFRAKYALEKQNLANWTCQVLKSVFLEK